MSRRRQRTVLGLLLIAQGRAVPADRLIEAVWQGGPSGKALASLHAYVSHLRRILEPDRPPRAAARVLVSSARGYALRLPADAVDAWRYEAGARRAVPSRPTRPNAYWTSCG
ncbi:winged helix-turn-helix domain-containing protein [Streptomyces goshikiensis]|uniref:AfsR/SARP family transcriptional regulator n=1 Tax=Streptomyces goshikiensis TaxID=1942 RepID=UPI0036AD323D